MIMPLVYMNMGYASAIATVLFLIILIITVIQLRVGKIRLGVLGGSYEK